MILFLIKVKKMFKLDGQTALVTGATGGIGVAIVDILHKAGAKIIATGTNETKLSALKSNFSQNLEIIQADLSDPLEATQLIDKVEKQYGEVNILICNAGLCRDGLSMRMKDEDWDAVINMNLSSIFRLNRAAIGKMMRRKYGRIINISSVVGFTGNIGQANYTATKAGMIGMAKSLALEVATRGITVNCVAPGFIASPMTENLNQEIKNSIINKVPIGKMGMPEDIGYGILFLASKESSYITGQTLHINGGMLMV
jgi:3-oxoacyl-[acyl-carrier protein] reductase